MSQVITKRFRVSRRRFLQGLTLTGTAVQIGLPPLVSMFNSTGTAYAAEGVAKPIESRFVFWFNGNGIPERYWIPGETGPDFHLSPVPQPAGPLPQRHPRSQRPGQPGGQRLRPRQRPPQGRQRRHHLYAVHRPRRGRSIHRPGHRRENRPRIALQLDSDRRLAGILRREHPAQYELGRLRPPAAAADAAEQAFRLPLRRARRRLGDPQAQHPRRRAAGRRGPSEGSSQGRRRARGGAPLGHPRYGARHRRPARRVPPHRPARLRRRHEGLAAHRQAAERPPGAGAGDAANPRCVLHADQRSRPRPLPLARPDRRAAPRLHSCRRQSSRRRWGRRPARAPRHHPLARRRVRLPSGANSNRFPKAMAPCSTTPACCTPTSTPKPIRTSAADSR